MESEDKVQNSLWTFIICQIFVGSLNFKEDDLVYEIGTGKVI